MNREDGGALALAAIALCATALLAVVVVDLALLVRGVAQAAGAADAAALAAVAAALPGDPDAPATAARRIAAANGAELVTCTCHGRSAAVTVRIPVATLLIGRLGVDHATGSARAELVPEPRAAAPQPEDGSLVVRYVRGVRAPPRQRGIFSDDRTDLPRGARLRPGSRVAAAHVHRVPARFAAPPSAGPRFMSAITALLFLGGSGLFAYPFFTDVYTTQVLQTRLEDQFQTITVQNAEDWTAQVEANQGTALTRFAIPSIGVETLVVAGTSPAALRAGAGHYPNTPKPGLSGNSAIAGHRTTYGRPFNRIDEVKPGDAIWLSTPIGDFKYVASGDSPSPTCKTPEGKATCITTPKDWSVIDQTPNAALTLTSCHPKGSAEQRIILRAYLAEEHPSAPTSACATAARSTPDPRACARGFRRGLGLPCLRWRCSVPPAGPAHLTTSASAWWRR
jgi:sortase A